MELDDLKSAWAQYDKKLTKSLKLNEELLQKMNRNHSKKEMQKPLVYEVANISLLFVLIVYMVAYSIRFSNEPKYWIPGSITAVTGSVLFIFAVIKANRFLNIDYYGSPVLKLQKDITILSKLVLKLRKYELLISPVLVLSLVPLLFKVIRNIDIYKNIKLFTIEMILILGIGIPVTLWINRHLYDEKFRNTERFLKEINDYESEK